MAMSRSHKDDGDEILFKQGSCSIIIKQGDLFDENDVDAIVIPTPAFNESNLDNFALFKSILSKANEDDKRKIEKVRSDLKLKFPQTISKKDRGYILAVPPYLGNPDKARELLRQTYSSCLNVAVKNNFRKIAFPTIGCGVIGFNTRDAAHEVYSALANFGQSKDGKNMDEIRIVIYNSDLWKDFTNVFTNLSCESDAKLKFIGISSKNSNSTEMPQKKNERQISQQQSRDGETNDYADDFDDTAEDERDRAKKKTSNLNPDSPEYQPRHYNQRRDLRRYLLSNKRTELHILQGDILQTKVDAIVNAANESMTGGGGVDGVIHRAAGNELYKACKAHKEIYRDVRLPTGRSRILLSYNMSKTTYYIINTAGPRYDDYPPQECKEYLISCYKTSLALANLYDLETIGFTAISCGIFGYPIDEGAEIALKTVDEKAVSMKKILFILKDDDIYDAWVKKAKELQFISLDDSDAVTTNTPKQSTSNTGKATEKLNRNDKSNVTKQPAEIKVIDVSTSDSTGKPVEPDHDNSPENLSPNPNKKSDSEEPTENEEDSNETNTDKKTNKVKSEKKGKSPNNSSNQNRTPNNNQNPEDQSLHRDTKISIITGDGGRGRGRKK